MIFVLVLQKNIFFCLLTKIKNMVKMVKVRCEKMVKAGVVALTKKG